MKLFSKYNRINLLLMTAVFLCSGLFYFIMIRMVLIHELDEALADYKDRIVLYVARHGNMPAAGELDDTYIHYEPVPEKEHDYFSLTDLPEPGKKKPHRYRRLSFTVDKGALHYRVVIAKPLEGTKLLIKVMLAATLGLLLVVILIAVLLNRVLLTRLWKPFYGTVATLRQFKIGKGMALQLPATSIEEFHFLNTTIEQSIALAEQEYTTLKEFTENAAHEMQTPLAIIRSKLDMVIQQEGLSEQQAEAVRSAYSGVKRLDKLNRSLLLLAKIDNGQFAETKMISLAGKIREKLEQLQEIIGAASVTVSSKLEDAVLPGNEALTDILLNNLLSNAVRHNVPGGVIDITLKPGLLLIGNTGQDAGGLDQDRLFRRFYTGRNDQTHHGLGLAIIRQICEQSGIHIKYDWTGDLHLFTLEWPVAGR